VKTLFSSIYERVWDLTILLTFGVIIIHMIDDMAHGTNEEIGNSKIGTTFKILAKCLN